MIFVTDFKRSKRNQYRNAYLLYGKVVEDDHDFHHVLFFYANGQSRRLPKSPGASWAVASKSPVEGHPEEALNGKYKYKCNEFIVVNNCVTNN